MPIALFPEDTRLFWLHVDKEVPLKERPVFVCKAPTRLVSIQWSKLIDEAAAIGEGPAAFELLHQAIAVGVKGWRNFRGTVEIADATSSDCIGKDVFYHEDERRFSLTGSEAQRVGKINSFNATASADHDAGPFVEFTFGRAALNAVLMNTELEEVAFGWPGAFRMTAEDKKGFTSPPPSAAAGSATDAEISNQTAPVV